MEKASQSVSLREKVLIALSKKADVLRSEILHLKPQTKSLHLEPQSIETLDTCPDGSMGYGLTAEGKFTGIGGVLGTYPVGSPTPTPSVTLLKPTPSCVSLAAVVSPVTSPVSSNSTSSGDSAIGMDEAIIITIGIASALSAILLLAGGVSIYFHVTSKVAAEPVMSNVIVEPITVVQKPAIQI